MKSTAQTLGKDVMYIVLRVINETKHLLECAKHLYDKILKNVSTVTVFLCFNTSIKADQSVNDLFNGSKSVNKFI